jgi:hypothetical protein
MPRRGASDQRLPLPVVLVRSLQKTGHTGPHRILRRMTRPRALDFALPGSAKLKPIQWPTVVDKDPPHPLVRL